MLVSLCDHFSTFLSSYLKTFNYEAEEYLLTTKETSFGPEGRVNFSVRGTRRYLSLNYSTQKLAEACVLKFNSKYTKKGISFISSNKKCLLSFKTLSRWTGSIPNDLILAKT